MCFLFWNLGHLWANDCAQNALLYKWKKLVGFWLCNWTSQTRLASCQHSHEPPSGGTMNSCLWNVSQGISVSWSLIGQLMSILSSHWPTAELAGSWTRLSLLPVSQPYFMSDTCNKKSLISNLKKLFFRYGLFDFEYTHQCQGTTEASKKEKLFLMSWCPDR